MHRWHQLTERVSHPDLQGEVHGFRDRVEQVSAWRRNPFAPLRGLEHVWTVRLDRAREGQSLPPIPIELRGSSFSGARSAAGAANRAGTGRVPLAVHQARVQLSEATPGGRTVLGWIESEET